MNIFFITAILFAGIELLAVWKNWQRLEYIAKPAVMLALFIWLLTSIGLIGPSLWFGLGILLSLTGDVFLMISLDRMFLAGLAAFLLAHIVYMIGFNIPLPEFSAWGIILAMMIGLGGARIARRILAPLAAKGLDQMRIPIIVYSMAISMMLLSAMMKLSDVTWNASAAVWVSAGAFLFYISDIILAWNKFVTPVKDGRVYNIAAYHLGQIMLIAGVVIHYKK